MILFILRKVLKDESERNWQLCMEYETPTQHLTKECSVLAKNELSTSLTIKFRD
jgi:hypothetical protein